MSTTDKQPAIVAHSLVKRYGARDVVAGVDLHVERGEVFGLLGPNGAGKTTTVEMIAGLRRPTQGTVRVLGLDPLAERDEFTRLVSLQPQAANLFPTLTVAETLELFGSFYERPRSVEEVIGLVGLEDSRNVRVKKLSGGQSRRLLIAVAVIGRPRLVLLDEPSAGLDPAARRELWNLIRSLRDQAVTVLLTTHHMDEAMELCDHLAIMVSGHIVAEGTPEQLIAEHSTTSRVRFMVPSGTDPGTILEASSGEEAKIKPVSGALLVQVDTADPDALLRRVTFQRGLHATGLRVEATSLEDVFLKLAGEEHRDWTTEPLPDPMRR
ncbi:ABC transporter ATP-binding protein [Leucobacter sp. wl10]|uniref:ABC transporter ATP-binding protein n=1 Tax=Leucobacter sp. wl10 TaxID=2304677 RepID=UPI000E5BC852|nr:ABC transporter ATP-binding protein [Leucobacter sp. wl10]RGE21582.1 ABC transporter ATP-binding protein [Leucobacter sp. wl10]